MVILVNLYFIQKFPFRHFNAETLQANFGPPLLIHIVFGVIALVVGPFQFFAMIRNRYPRFHRLTGRIYLASILIGGISALYLAIFHNILDQHKLAFGFGALGLATAWLTTSGMALWAILKRRIVQHKEWMIRSYVVTCGFSFYRIMHDAALFAGYGDYGPEVSGIFAWACWSVPLLFTEIILQARKIGAPKNLGEPLLDEF